MSDNIREELKSNEGHISSDKNNISKEQIDQEQDVENNTDNIDEEQVTTIFKDGKIVVVDDIPGDVLNTLKEKYGTLFGIYINSQPILYRKIGIDDYINYQNIIAAKQEEIYNKYKDDLKSGNITEEKISYEVYTMWDESLVDLFVVYPENIIDKVKNGELPGGSIYTIAQGILSNNGFIELEPIFISRKTLELDPELLNTLNDEIVKQIEDLDIKDIKNWIEEYNELGLVMFYGKLYIVRGFKYDEYMDVKELTAKLPNHMLNIELVRRFMLYPNSMINDIPAGLVLQVLPDMILSLSGFTPNTQPDIVIAE